MRGEVGEVLRRRVRETSARAAMRREADVRQRRERHPASPTSPRAQQRRRRPAPWFAPNACDRSSRNRSAASRAATPPSVTPSLSKLISATIGSAGHRAHRLDRDLELVEVVERLEDEQVGAAALEDARLLGEQLAVVLLAVLDVAERPDRAADQHLAAGDLARLPRELHRRSS